MTARNWSSPASSGTGAVVGLRLDAEAGLRGGLLAGLPEVLLPVRSVKC